MIDSDQPTADAIYALAIAPNGSYFAARRSGLYRSDDDGKTWHNAYASLNLTEPLSTTALALSLDFAQDGTLFAGVAGGILRSTDAGQTWIGVLLPEPPPLIAALAVSPVYASDHQVFAATFENGVFYSTDRGEAWYGGNFALLDRRVLALALSPNFGKDRTALIGTETGVFSSKNGGRSWDVVDLPYVPVTSLAFSPDGSVYAGTDGDGLYVAPDVDSVWQRSNLSTTLSIGLLLTPTPCDRYVFSGATLYQSHDAGESWASRLFSATVTAAALIDAQTLLIGGSDGSIQRINL